MRVGGTSIRTKNPGGEGDEPFDGGERSDENTESTFPLTAKHSPTPRIRLRGPEGGGDEGMGEVFVAYAWFGHFFYFTFTIL